MGRKDSYDLGKFTLEGSRPANALFLHSNLNILGTIGYEVLMDKTVAVTQYMAEKIKASPRFELVVDPMINILLYRYIPPEFEELVKRGSVTPAMNETIDAVNVQLQTLQKAKGET